MTLYKLLLPFDVNVKLNLSKYLQHLIDTDTFEQSLRKESFN